MTKFYPVLKLEQFPRQKILARLGYYAGQTQLKDTDEVVIQEIFSESRRLIQPRFAYVSGKVKIISSEEIFLDNFRIVSKDIVRLLQNCFLAYGVAITIGQSIENWRDYLKKNQKLKEALIVDAVGSEVVEEFAEMFNQQLIDWLARDGRKATRRFSCGYGDWELSGQKEFVDWIGAKDIGINVTPTAQLIPEKSVTFLIGVYDEKR